MNLHCSLANCAVPTSKGAAEALSHARLGEHFVTGGSGITSSSMAPFSISSSTSFLLRAANAGYTLSCSAYIPVVSHGLPHFMGTRIQFPSNFDFQQWDRIAVTPEDKLVIQFLTYGFLMGYSSPIPTSTMGNHPSAIQNSNDLTAYITKELQHGAMLGPFSALPFYPWCQTNQLLTRPKRDSQ